MAIAVPHWLAVTGVRTVLVADEITRLAREHLRPASVVAAGSSSSSSPSSSFYSSSSSSSSAARRDTGAGDAKQQQQQGKKTGVGARLCALGGAVRELGVKTAGLLTGLLCSSRVAARFDRWCQPAPSPDAVVRAGQKEHYMLMAELTDRRGQRAADGEGARPDASNTVVVGTYHCPCAFRDQPLMLLHTGVAAHLVRTYAAGRPHLLAGDFNSKPGDPAYALLTGGGELERVGPAGTALPVHAMRSAYATANGREPTHTCHSTTPSGDAAAAGAEHNAFSDTLDYIFVSPEFEVAAAAPLPDAPTASAHPSAHEGSDHLKVSVDLVLPAAPR